MGRVAKQLFLLVGEGPSDLGRRQRPEHCFDDLSEFDEQHIGGAVRELVVRALEEALSIPREAVELQPRLLKQIQKHGGGYKGKVLAAMVTADNESFDGLIFVIDRDRDSERPGELKSGREEARRKEVAIPTALGCCIETIEAWLLADRDAVSEALGVSRNEVARNPENLDGKEGSGRHPKDEMDRLHRLSSDDLDWVTLYKNIAATADLSELARHCPKGFKPFLDELRGLR